MCIYIYIYIYIIHNTMSRTMCASASNLSLWARNPNTSSMDCTTHTVSDDVLLGSYFELVGETQSFPTWIAQGMSREMCPRARAVFRSPWEERFYTQPATGSNRRDRRCARIETAASTHHPLWVVVVVEQKPTSASEIRGSRRRPTRCRGVLLPQTCRFCAYTIRRENSQCLAKSSPYAGPSAGTEVARFCGSGTLGADWGDRRGAEASGSPRGTRPAPGWTSRPGGASG